MFLAWRDLKYAKGRFALVAGVIALIALLTTFLSGLAAGLVDDGISGLRRLPLTHLAFQTGAKSSFSRSSLPPASLDAFRSVPGVQASELGVSFFNARSTSGETVDLALFGVPPDSFLVPEGPARSALSGTPGLVLSEEYRQKGIAVGDELTVVGPDVTLPVLGFTYAGSYGHVNIAFTSLEQWQKLVYGDSARGRFSAVALRVEGNPDLTAANRAAGTEVDTKEVAYRGSPGFTAETTTMDLIRGFLLIISSLIVGAFFTVWTVQRTRQIGLLKALGASNGYVLRDALGQLAVVLSCAVALGAIVAVALGSRIGSGVPFSLQGGPILSAMAALFILGMLGSLVAIRRVTSVDPVLALGSEN